MLQVFNQTMTLSSQFERMIPSKYPLFFFILLLLSLSYGTSNVENETLSVKKNKPYKITTLGAIADYTCRAGKEEKLAMEMAIQDFYGNTKERPILYFKNSKGDPIRAASSAKTLIKRHNVQAIIGLGTSQEVVFVSELGNKFEVPLLSLANEVPVWATLRSPFLINAARSQSAQMKALAAIIQNSQWRRVNIIYEDRKVDGIIPYLFTSLHEVDAEVSELLPLPPSPPYQFLSEKLVGLKNGQCRVFIVHTSLTMATSIFKEAMKLGMMEKEFVWITTSSTTDFVDTFSATDVILSMQGLLGVQSYFSHCRKRFKDFRTRFRVLFCSQYPEEPFPEPGIYALQAYDAMWAVFLAIEGKLNREKFENSTSSTPTASMGGINLLNRILTSKFEGLTGPVYFKSSMLHPSRTFSMVNVVGTGYLKVGYWTDELGFSRNLSKNDSNYSNSMGILRPIYWPGGHSTAPRGWSVATKERRLKIGVPSGNSHKEFVNVAYDGPGGSIRVSGFVIEVFNATVARLPYALPFDFFGHEGSYDDLVQSVYNQTYDAAVGDIAILANRSKYAEFSQPFTQPGIQMVVYERPKIINMVWLFTRPFTGSLWLSIAIITVYNGFVIWLIERKNHNPDFNGPWWKQIGTMLPTSFITLFSLKGEGLYSNLSRMVMVAWLFIALVITQSFTANLASYLVTSSQQFHVDPVNIDTLRNNSAKIGCDGDSFVTAYLREVLRIKGENIVPIREENEYATALASGKITAAFLEIPYIDVFLARYCKGFSTSGPIYKVGGFGFVFPKNSPYIPDISQAVVNISETVMSKFQSSLTNSKCSAPNFDDHQSIGLAPFMVPFLVTIGTSTIALFLFSLPSICRFWRMHGLFENDGQHQQLELQRLQRHDPSTDERILFASEMENQGSWR